MTTESIKNQFNPDYICDDPSCKSREVTMDISKECTETVERYEAKSKALETRLKEADKIVELALDFSDRIHSAVDPWRLPFLLPVVKGELDDAINEYQEKWDVKPAD